MSWRGRWDEVEELAEHALGDLEERPGSEFIYAPLTIVHALRGRRDAARATLAHLDGWGEGDDEELQAMHGAVAVVVALAADEPEQALALGEQMARSALATLTATDDAFRIGWPDSVEAALRRWTHHRRLGHCCRSSRKAWRRRRGPRISPPSWSACRRWSRRPAMPADELSVAAGLQAAADAFRALSYPYWSAVCELELGGWLLARGDPERGESQLAGAAATLEQLGATPALARLAAVRAGGGSCAWSNPRPGRGQPA